jgi:hypothetical protein
MEIVYKCLVGCIHKTNKIARNCEKRRNKKKMKEKQEERKHLRLYGAHGIPQPCRNYRPGVYEGG